MAENKKSFVLYCDIIHTVSHLTDEQAGILFKHILGYVNDKNPETDDVFIKLAFEPIKQILKRDLKKWEKYVEKQRENGAKGGRPTKTQITQAFSENPSQPKKADSVSANVSVSENTAQTQSNLFKTPKIPTKQQVLEAIVNAGGDKEMAKSFYDKHEGTGWYVNGSAIVNYVALCNKFVSTWKSMNEKKNGYTKEPESTAPKLTTLKP